MIRTSILSILAMSAWLLLNPGTASAANCTAAERKQANDHLSAIAADQALTTRLVARHLPFGPHKGAQAAQGGPDNERLLVQGGYAILHDGDLRTTLWVAHELTGSEVDAGTGGKRKNCFRRDPRLEKAHAGTPTDYNEPIFDQGHMANDRDLRDDVTEALNTYMMSNMSPQYCRFNRGIWLTLEHLGRIWAKAYGSIHVTSGAIFDFNRRDARDKDKAAARMGSRNQKGRVAIPSHYYKIFLRKDGEQWRSIAFLLEHHGGPRGKTWSETKPLVLKAAVPLETIEKRAEAVFHPGLDRSALVESMGGAGWDFMKGKSNLEDSC